MSEQKEERNSMQPQILIPYRPKNPKTRLSRILSQEEREEFGLAMLHDVVSAVKGVGGSPRVLAPGPLKTDEIAVIIQEGDLSETLNSFIRERESPLLVIMADLPLATSESLERVLTDPHDLVIVPGRGGGTNLILIREPRKFSFDYYKGSFQKHLAIARAAGLSVGIVDSFFLSTDMDEEDDLVELLIHGTGESREYLIRSGFELIRERGRVSVRRRGTDLES